MAKAIKAPCILLKPIITDQYHWSLLNEYLAAEKARLVTRLLNCSEDELRAIQGEIKALDKISGLKLQLITEEESRKSG